MSVTRGAWSRSGKIDIPRVAKVKNKSSVVNREIIENYVKTKDTDSKTDYNTLISKTGLSRHRIYQIIRQI
tara:strand:- start:802 stop:1014 length:213 start_codon:yes stop_codon:yes gene_type:complete